MKLSDLKDGMIVLNRNGDARFIMDERMVDNKQHTYSVGYINFNEDLTHKNDHMFDIVKASYMGEALWERVEYVSFMEAVEHGELVTTKRLKAVADKFDLHNKTGFKMSEILNALYIFKGQNMIEDIKKDDWIIVKRKS